MLGMCEYTLAELAKEKQKTCLQRGAAMRLARQVSGKMALECVICRAVGTLLVRIGQKLREAAGIQPTVDLPDNELTWPKAIDTRRSQSYFA